MKVRKGIVSAAIAVLALGSAAWADDSVSVATPTDLQNGIVPAAQIDSQPLLADDATPPAPPEKPLMMGLDKAGVGKTLENWGINIGGYAEISYMWDFTKPKGSNIQAFDGPYKNTFDINQIDLEIDRTISADPAKFNWGFKVEGLFGRDAAFIHSNGILDNSTKHGGGPKNQIDLEQAYLLINLPVGNGILLQAGKFATLLGEEYINPTENQFLSHSFSYEFGIPLTQTGIIATYQFSPALTATAGFTRGWNQSTSDNNGDLDFLGEVIYKLGDKLTFTGNLSVGPQGVLPFGPPDYKDWWTVPEIIASYTATSQLTLSADAVYGNAAGSGQWYGVAGYAKYVLSPIITLNGRLEWYDDAKGFTTGFGSTLNAYEATAGVGITPLPDSPIFQFLTLRPELRYDFADHPVFDGGKWGELTASVDAIMQF